MTLQLHERDIKRWIAAGLKRQLNIDASESAISLEVELKEFRNGKGRVTYRNAVFKGVTLSIPAQ